MKIKYKIIIVLVIIYWIIYTIASMAVTGTAKEFKYKEHSYIYFINEGIVHNPKCEKCYQLYD